MNYDYQENIITNGLYNLLYLYALIITKTCSLVGSGFGYIYIIPTACINLFIQKSNDTPHAGILSSEHTSNP